MSAAYLQHLSALLSTHATHPPPPPLHPDSPTIDASLEVTTKLGNLLGPFTGTDYTIADTLASRFGVALHNNIHQEGLRRIKERMTELMAYSEEPYCSNDDDDDDADPATTTDNGTTHGDPAPRSRENRSSATSIKQRLAIAPEEWQLLLHIGRRLPKLPKRSAIELRKRMHTTLAVLLKKARGTAQEHGEGGDKFSPRVALSLLYRFIYLPEVGMAGEVGGQGGGGERRLRNLDRTIRELRRAIAAVTEAAVAAEKRRK